MGTDDAVMLAAPLVVWLYDARFLSSSVREPLRRRWGLYTGLAACWVLMAAPYLLAGTDARLAFQTKPVLSPTANAMTQPGVILHYFTLSLWPVRVCLDYSDWPVADVGALLLPLAILGAFLAATVWVCLKWPKIGFLAICFFLLLGTAFTRPFGGSISETQMYLPLAVECVALVVVGFELAEWAGRQWPHAGVVVAGFALPLMVVLGFLTYQRNTEFYHASAILRDTINQRPNNVRVRLHLANALLQEGKMDAAIAEYKALLESSPGDEMRDYRRVALNNLAIAYLATNRTDEAFRFFADFPSSDLDNASTLSNLGARVWANGDASAAVRFFREAARLRPQSSRYYYELAVALQDGKQPEEAEAAVKEGLRIDPKWPAEARQQAWQLATAADPKQRNGLGAIFLARQASAATTSQQPEALDTLAAAYASAGRFPDAIKAADQAQHLAAAANNKSLEQQIQARLLLYKAGQPYSANPASPDGPK